MVVQDFLISHRVATVTKGGLEAFGAAAAHSLAIGKRAHIPNPAPALGGDMVAHFIAVVVMGKSDRSINRLGVQIPDFDDGNGQVAQQGQRARRVPAPYHDLLLIAEDPTAGVDVGAKAEIYQLLYDAMAAGMGVLIVSTDFEEIATICHRALVFSRGQMVAELTGVQLSTESLIQAASPGEAA